MSADPARVQKLDRAFQVSLGAHLSSKSVHDYRKLWTRLGGLESWLLRERLDSTPIDKPIFIAGLARSGTTILLELLAGHSHIATHRYCDFPFVFTPFWWHEVLKRAPRTDAELEERAHGDGLPVGPDSPEAMEEPLWMAFFPHIHSRGTAQMLDAGTSHPAFEQFYGDHIKKLLLSRGRRYLSKGNYNIARLQYLQKLFPDARFVVPIRHPRSHVASLIKQHKLFVEGETRHPRALEHMRHVGHFEFGLDRRAIEVGDPAVSASIYDLWERGEEIRGWARYWAHLYGWMAERLHDDFALREATVTVRFEDFCEKPATTLGGVLGHVELPDEEIRQTAANRVHAPDYYRPTFTPDEEAAIVEETAEVAEKYGYRAEVQPNTPRPQHVAV
jgi:hypothetical protein